MAAPSFVQMNSGSGSGASLSVTFTTQATAQNSCLIVVAKWGDEVNGATISDNKTGNTWHLASGPTLYGATNNKRGAVWYAVTSGASSFGASHQITITLDTTSTTTIYLFIHEYTGTDLVSPIDRQATQTFTGSTAVTSGNTATTTQADELIFGAAFCDTSITSAGGSFSQRVSLGGHMTEDRQVSSTGAYAATFTDDSSSSTNAVFCVTLQPPFSAATFDQSAFQFRDDNGSESGASSLASENTAVTRAAGVNTRIRVQVNTSGDAPATAYQLEYRKQGDTDWTKL